MILRSLTIWNLADEPGGCGGIWDFAVMTDADRVILDDVVLCADHDTLIVYGVGSRVYVRGSYIQGRGDFIASFASTFIEDSALETIRDRGHFLFQAGEPGLDVDGQEALVVRDSTFTGETHHVVWPFGATNLWSDAVVYLVDNVFEYDIGANRPLIHYHNPTQAESSAIYRHGNTQAHSTGPLIWDFFSIPGPVGNPRIDLPIGNGPPSVTVLTHAQAEAVRPDIAFWGWDARVSLKAAISHEVPAINRPFWVVGFVALALLAVPYLRAVG